MAIRAVLDASLLAHGLLHPTGAARGVVDAWVDGRFTQVTCIALLDELRHILTHPPLEARLTITDAQVNRVLAALLTESEVVPGRVAVSVFDAFPREDCLLSCAIEGTVDYVVTAGQHLLLLGEYGGFPIVTPQQFLQSLGG